jgi:hypothetical protein
MDAINANQWNVSQVVAKLDTTFTVTAFATLIGFKRIPLRSGAVDRGSRVLLRYRNE